jgi:hypothetical protein
MVGGTEVEGNSRLAYDFSINGGQTWANENQVYTPTGPDPGTGYPENAARYPQGAILNPEGNTNPDNAYYTYFAATMTGQNDNWGGYAYGSNLLTMIPPQPSQVNLISSNNMWRLIPDAFHITQQGHAWYVDVSAHWDGADYVYTGNLILGHGEIIDGEISYTEELIPFLEEGEPFNDFKIAFAPDGQTGYICAMAENTGDPVDNTNYHPILLKTTDGGASWEDPIDIQFGGEDGIESIKNYIPDTIVTLLEYYADWSGDRDELIFNMGFHIDMAVDAMGNPYIIGMISLGTDEGTWYPGLGTEWTVYSKDGGDTWMADPLWDQYWFDGLLGTLETYNRPQVSIDYEGYHLFYSWLDSEAEQAEENDRPNIYVLGYDIEEDTYSDVTNATYFSQAWNKAFYGSQSYYVFKLSDERFEIPLTYAEFTVADDPDSQINYWYIDDFVLTPVSVPEFNETELSFKVGQNYPNPASQSTEILVTAETNLPIELKLHNLLGQLIYTDVIQSSAYAHSFSVDVSSYHPGLYFYSIHIGNQKVTQRMVIE